MSHGETRALRSDTIGVFYHGFDNYMEHAFPEDELKPLSCAPLTRDSNNPAHIEVNDVLGNYSLTLVDSLSTLAILASSPPQDRNGRDPFGDFQDGVAALVEQYGDGSVGPAGQGLRSRGFDLDSKVQVFETVIRGVGGLLSAHLFAVGDLPITGYKPVFIRDKNTSPYIRWDNELNYDGQLLRLAKDLATRLLPAFHTVTGLPYPRVNLRTGIPFYINSPLNYDAENAQSGTPQSGTLEITETCSAGAGSLVLEFTTLSRLTGDDTFERLAKRAFRAVWDSKSAIGLVGAGIDAETGQWQSPFTGIGAGIDSFFEYALKTYILLSGSVTASKNSSGVEDVDYFLDVWENAHAGIKRHLYRSASYQHPHYIQGDLYTGATRAFWIDSLSAYYPGLLTLAGKLDEAIETHLLYAALWTRYSALPERWSAATGNIDSGLRWWGGRPEFIESTWYLYRATKDPWYLHTGEMALRDIKRRCWTECGWAGLEDVRTDLLKDRMESFFLGETIKYLYLLFDSEHPLNKLDAPWVFTTEGHPLIIPRIARKSRKHPGTYSTNGQNNESIADYGATCPLPPASEPFSISAVPARADFFHAASLARMHHLFEPSAFEVAPNNPMFHQSSTRGPEHAAYYPWTLPAKYIPKNGISSKMENRVTFDLSFPVLPNTVAGPLTLQRTHDGIVIHSVSGLKLTLLREVSEPGTSHHASGPVYRILGVSHLALGRDEKVYITPEVVAALNPSDPYFTRHRDTTMLDVVADLVSSADIKDNLKQRQGHAPAVEFDLKSAIQEMNIPGEFTMDSLRTNASLFQQLLKRFTSALDLEASQGTSLSSDAPAQRPRSLVDAVAAVGIGAGTLPDVPDAPLSMTDSLPWTSIYLTDEMCLSKLPANVPREYQVIVMKRGTCSFSNKIHNIPSFPPNPSSLQLVVVVSYPEHDEPLSFIRPLLDQVQYTPGGIARPNPIPMVMVDGDDEMLFMLGTAKGIGIRRRYHFSSQGLRISNLIAQ